MKKFWKRTEGFTLVELIVVIAILGILACVGTVGYGGYVKKANLAADETLLGTINTAFATACLNEGESIAEVFGEIEILSDGALETDANGVVITFSGKALADEKAGDIVESFNDYYQGGANNKFKVAKDTKVHIRNGVAVIGDYYVDEAAKNAYLASTLGQNLTSAELLDLVDTSLADVNIAWGDTYFAQATGAQSFKDTASAMMGISNYDTYIEEKRQAAYDQWFVDNNVDPGNCSRADRNAANEYADQEMSNLKLNMMVAVSAKNAQVVSSDILTILKKGAEGKTEIKNNLTGNATAAMGVSQAALAYGLYASYAQSKGVTANVYDFATALSGVDPDFNSYVNGTLEGTDVNKDLAGLLGAMSVVGDQSTDTISEAITNGFDDSDLLANLEQALGK